MLNIEQFQFTQREIPQWVILFKSRSQALGEMGASHVLAGSQNSAFLRDPRCGNSVTPSIREGTPNTPHSNATHSLLLRLKLK